MKESHRTHVSNITRFERHFQFQMKIINIVVEFRKSELPCSQSFFCQIYDICNSFHKIVYKSLIFFLRKVSKCHSGWNDTSTIIFRCCELTCVKNAPVVDQTTVSSRGTHLSDNVFRIKCQCKILFRVHSRCLQNQKSHTPSIFHHPHFRSSGLNRVFRKFSATYAQIATQKNLKLLN